MHFQLSPLPNPEEFLLSLLLFFFSKFLRRTFVTWEARGGEFLTSGQCSLASLPRLEKRKRETRDGGGEKNDQKINAFRKTTFLTDQQKERAFGPLSPNVKAVVAEWSWHELVTSSSGAPEDPPCRGNNALKSFVAQSSYVDVVWKLRERSGSSCVVLVTLLDCG
ncbi:hypothetical protein TNCV_2889851 [Trichonephila clavipes]|nr:hypothetical protein TNCV_2889851 [Trichonephila clavipes]